MSQMGRPGVVDNRPMTSNRASGFSASQQGASWDPTGQARSATMGPAPALQKRGDNSPEEQCMEMERRQLVLHMPQLRSTGLRLVFQKFRTDPRQPE